MLGVTTLNNKSELSLQVYDYKAAATYKLAENTRGYGNFQLLNYKTVS
jgi:hypothetical protein